MASIQCSWSEPTAFVARRLRRFTGGHTGKWTCEEGWHEAREEIEPKFDPAGPGEGRYTHSGDNWPHDDPRWPKVCAKGCGYEFKEEDDWQLFVHRVYVRMSDRKLFTLAWGEVPVGAMYDAWWLPDGYVGDDGIHLTVQLPDNTPWTIDGPSSSCSERKVDPEDGHTYIGHDTRTGHHCWTRTGDPKANPPTVSAQPSIASGNPETYHGFLTSGFLTNV